MTSHSAPENLNSNTVVPPGFRDVTSELDASLERESGTIADHFRAALADDRDIVARVALLTVDDVALHELPSAPDGYLVVGRHSEATVRGDGAASLSLRHVLLIPKRAEPGTDAVLDVVALAPTMRMGLWPRPLPDELAGRCTALVLGDAMLLVAPVARGDRKAELFIAPEIEMPLSLGQGTKVRPEPQRVESRSHVRMRTSIPALSFPESDERAADAKVVLEVRNGDEKVRIALREPWLVGGIVLGRTPGKCSHASLARLLTSDMVSRCHLYLRREHDQIVFYDTASTYGVWLSEDAEEPVRRVAVPALVDASDATAINPAQTRLWLTPDVTVTIYRAGEHETRT